MSEDNTVVPELKDEKSSLKIAMAGAFLALLGIFEGAVFANVVVPPAEMASGIHTLFIGVVTTAGAFLYKELQK